VTIYDIAKEAEVSGSTVSRVMNGKAGVNRETREKVQALLDKYHFFANETARGLVNQSPRMMGILIADIRNTHYSDGAYLIAQECARYGYCSLIFNTGDDDASKVEYLRILSARRVDGIAMIGSTYQCDAVRDAVSLYFPDKPVAIANGYLDMPHAYGVLADEESGIFSCVKLLQEKGKRRIVYVTGTDTPSNRNKLAGYEKGMRLLYGMEPEVWQAGGAGYQEGYGTTRRILTESKGVDAVIYAVDLLAAGGIRAVLDSGLRIPTDIALVGVDNSRYAYVTTPKLTSLDTKLSDLSLTCARVLVNAVSHEDGAKRMVVFSSIVERETT
jgi:LacI family transcriptional regulator